MTYVLEFFSASPNGDYSRVGRVVFDSLDLDGARLYAQSTMKNVKFHDQITDFCLISDKSRELLLKVDAAARDDTIE